MKRIGTYTWDSEQATPELAQAFYIGVGETPVLASMDAKLSAHLAGWDASRLSMCEMRFIKRVEIEDHVERYVCCLFVSGAPEPVCSVCDEGDQDYVCDSCMARWERHAEQVHA